MVMYMNPSPLTNRARWRPACSSTTHLPSGTWLSKRHGCGWRCSRKCLACSGGSSRLAQRRERRKKVFVLTTTPTPLPLMDDVPFHASNTATRSGIGSGTFDAALTKPTPPLCVVCMWVSARVRPHSKATIWMGGLSSACLNSGNPPMFIVECVPFSLYISIGR